MSVTGGGGGGRGKFYGGAASLILSQKVLSNPTLVTLKYPG